MKEKLASVKFINAGKIYYFSTNINLTKGNYVVVETIKGLELGVLSKNLENINKFKLENNMFDFSDIKTYIFKREDLKR